MDQENEVSLGEYLRESREKNNYSIEKLSLKTRISPSVIKSLESEEFESLPSPAYLKGFVTTYVKVFSLDESTAFKKLMDTYEKKTGNSFPSLNHARKYEATKRDRLEEPNEVINNSTNIFDTIKPMIPYIIGVFVVASGFGIYKLASHQINNEAKSYKENNNIDDETSHESTETSSPATDLTSQNPSPSSSSAPETPATSEVLMTPEVKPEAKPVVKTEEAKPKEKKEENSSVKTEKRLFPHIDFKPIIGPLYTPKPDAAENKDESLMPGSYKAKMDSTRQNLYVNAASGETWVSYKVDEEPIQNEFIREGKALFLQGDEIRMFFGNINVTKIFLNNTYIDGYTKTGVKTLIFPQENAPKYLRPLFPKSANGEYFTAEEYREKMKEEEKNKAGNP